MAIVKCKECGNEISTKATTCPQCGNKIKKTSGCAMVVAAVIGLAGFGSIASTCSHSDKPATDAESKAQAPNPYATLTPDATLKQGHALVAHWEKQHAIAKAALAGKGDMSGDLGVTTTQWNGIREKLQAIPKGSVQYVDAQSLLEKMKADDATDKADFSKYQAAAKKDSRADFAHEMEKRFLSNGYSVTVRATGANKDTLDFKYVLVSKAFAYQAINQTDLTKESKEAGFKKIVFRDGYDETYTVDLTKNK